MQTYLLDLDTALIAPRTVVRRFREGDGEAFYECIQDNYSRLHDHFPSMLPSINSKEDAEFYVRSRMADWLLQKEYSFGIWHNKDAKYIGFIRFFQIDWRVPKAEISYFIDKDYGGQGLMTESMNVALRFAFDQLKIEKLSLRTGMENIPSQRLARKVGFHREGDLRADFRRLSGELIDTMVFGLTQSEWRGI